MPHLFSPRSIERLMRPDRFGDLNVGGFLSDMGLEPGMTFVDIGCGPGFFTRPALDVVGPGGLVYAVDVQQEMLQALKDRLWAENLRPLLSPDGSLPMEDGCVDLALCAYVLHEAASAESFLGEIKRVMKAGAKLIIIDWDRLREENGPPYADRVSRNEAAGLIRGAGLNIVNESVFSSSHYLFQITKSD